MRSNPEKILRQMMARFVDEEVIPKAREMDEKGSFPWEMFQKLADMGAFTIRYPRNKGGGGGNTTLFCIMCEELARGYMSLAAITAMQCLMGTNFLFKHGTDELRETYFHPAMKGEMVASFALTEPEAATDLGSVRTYAERTDDGWLINGMKTWITNAPVANFFTVLCQTKRGAGLRGLNFFFIPRTTPGVSTSPKFEKLGTRATEISELAFTDVLIPLENRLGDEGRGMANLFSILAEIRTMTAALALGLVPGRLQCVGQVRHGTHPVRTPHRPFPVDTEQDRQHGHPDMGLPSHDLRSSRHDRSRRRPGHHPIRVHGQIFRHRNRLHGVG